MNDVPPKPDPKAMVRGLFNTVAPDYDLGPGCFNYFGRRLVEAAGIEPGQRVLDIAAGRGAALLPAAERVGVSGEVIGIDLSDAMARHANAEAERRGLAARVRVMDAEALEFPDASFDRVLCGFGVMFFPNQARAMAEMHRVLKPGGRLALSTWRISQAEEMSAVTAALGFGTGSPPGWINKPDKLQQLIESAGFRDIKVSEDAHEFRYAGLDEYWQQARGTGLRGTLDRLDAAGVERVRTALTQRLGSKLGANDLRLTSIALIAVATV